MPRQPRIDSPDLLYHVIVRGIERRKIFCDDDDRRSFLGRLPSLLVETDTECFAWALIPNHFHLLLRPRHIKLSRFMRRLLTGYTVTFNRRHDRSGHLFQNRYKSIVCEEDVYLLEPFSPSWRIDADLGSGGRPSHQLRCLRSANKFAPLQHPRGSAPRL